MAKVTLASIKKRAAAAADGRQEPTEKLLWSVALAEAPVPEGLPEARVRDFQKAYALRLVKLGLAKPAGKPGKATKLPRRLLTATQAEFDEMDRRAKESGPVSWSAWALKKLLR